MGVASVSADPACAAGRGTGFGGSVGDSGDGPFDVGGEAGLAGRLGGGCGGALLDGGAMLGGGALLG